MQESNAKEGRIAARVEANPKARWVWARPQGWGLETWPPARGCFDLRLCLGALSSQALT